MIMKLIVTGGCGFIGSNFIRYWLDQHPDDSITNIDALTYSGNIENLSDISSDSRYTFVQGDICDNDLAYEVVDNADLVVHFAAESHVDRSIEGALPFIRTNVEGTLSLLEAVRNRRTARFHHVSTDEVFGALPLDKPKLKFTEQTCYAPRSPYAASKAASDHLVRSYFHTHNLPVTISNCSNNYGPYQYPEKLIPLVITRALNDEKIPVYGNGQQVRDWIHVVDHCRAIDTIVHKGKIGETYLVGGESERTNMWIISQILEKLNKPTDLLVHVPGRKGHDPRYAVDIAKINKELGFEPKTKMEEGLNETIDWYKQNGSWWKPLKKNADKLTEKYLNSK
jgi:dTDP-glucose 4,6-dehydratase